MSMENTKQVTCIMCENCGAEIEVQTYSKQYIADLRRYAMVAHNALKTIIDSNKVSPAMKIYYPNSEQYETLGNIRAEAPHKFSHKEEKE